MKQKVFLLLFFYLAVSFACEVPVFRYALERWERDLYKLFVVHRGELNEAQKKQIEDIQKKSIGYGGNANLVIYRVDLNNEKQSSDFHDSYSNLKDLEVSDTPQMVLLYPNITKVYDPVWQGDLHQENIDELLNSKATEKLMNGILQGYSSTFLLMESGNKEKDDKASAVINEAMIKLKKELEIPEGIVKQGGEVTGGKLTAYEAASIDPSNVLKSGIPLKIDFHMVRMPRNDSNPIFRAILGKVFKSDSKEEQPRLFAFFGRGRLLGPMVGDEITVQHITQLSSYLCSACSCQVKRQNPGIDFLTNLDWPSYLEGSEVVVEKELPPLIGMIDVAQPSAVPSQEVIVESPKELPKNFTVFRNTAFTLIGLIVFILGGTLIMRKK